MPLRRAGPSIVKLDIVKSNTQPASKEIELEKKSSNEGRDTIVDWEPIPNSIKEPIGIQMMRIQGLLDGEMSAEAMEVKDSLDMHPDLVVFEVDGLRLSASKLLLSASSPYFKEFLTAGLNTIIVDDYPFEIVQEMINWIEDENYDVNPSMDLLELSSSWELDALKHVVEHKMEMKLNTLSVYNCLAHLVRSDQAQAMRLKRSVMKFVLKNWREVVDYAPDFRSFPIDHPQILVDLLNMGTDCINVGCLNMYI